MTYTQRFQEAGCDGLELNMAILPYETTLSCEDVDRLFSDIINTLRKSVSIPISIKVSHNFTDMANFMQRLSGIATEPHRMVAMLKGTHTQLLDTRKTTPNMRLLEKYAVKCGGGTNHRIGLYDMVMLKDNHIDFAGGIEAAIDRTRDYLKAKGKDLRIEIEVRNLDELQRVLDHGGVDRIMLDNFDTDTLREAVKRIDGKYETEASGGITEKTLRMYAETGVDFISVGALTHHIKSLDLSLVKK
jgi:nicotinate-nucleotide pyrophosphorylase (carboxylating)